jgi:glutamate synthase (NADPH/NADH) large chain
MVELQPLDDVDRQFLADTVRRHRDLTGSDVAARILDDWEVSVTSFRKVMPKDYQRVLTVIAESEAAGLDEAATVDRIMEAARA